MNVQLFNFHAAGSSVRESSLAQSNEHLECSSEPPGSSSSAMVCILWKGRCTAPSPRTAMYIAVVFARAHIARQRALAVPAGTAVTIASVSKVLLDCPLVPKLAAPKELSNSAVCYDTSLVRSMCSFFCDV